MTAPDGEFFREILDSLYKGVYILDREERWFTGTPRRKR